MNKNEAIWIVLRFIGLYLVIKALMLLPELASSLWFVFSVGSELVIETPGAEFAVKATLKVINDSLIAVVLYGIGGFYFLRRGKAVFNLIRVPSASE
ncbi:MAG: hypothetical protein ABW170_22230 [Candidatus Thiodiazotropha sp. L084R]